MKELIGAAAATSLLASNVAAQNRIDLSPATAWVLNYDDDSCALQRQFGGEGQQTYLELRKFGSQRDMQVIIASKDFERRTGGFKIAFQPVESEPREIAGFDFRLDAEYEGKLFSHVLSWQDQEIEAAFRDFIETTTLVTDAQRSLVLRAIDAGPESSELARLSRDTDYEWGARIVNEAFRLTDAWRSHRDRIEREVDGIFVDGAFDKRLFLRTGDLHAPMEAMRTCLEELYSHWGIDVEAHRTLRRPALPLDYSDLVRRVSSDYPSRMIRAGMQGYLRVRLNVSAEGKPTACHLQSPINEEEFENTACTKLMRYATFAPALDSEGQPIASFYQTSIVYMLDR